VLFSTIYKVYLIIIIYIVNFIFYDHHDNYIMRNFAVLIIILWLINPVSASAFSPNDIEWAPAVSTTLYKGGTLTNGEYMVKALQFSSPVPGIKNIKGDIVPETDVDPSVLLEIYKNGALIKELIMAPQSEAYIDPDYEVKVSATGFTARNAREWVFEYYNPYATIAIQTRAKPKLEITVTTDKTTYTSYSSQVITAKVEVKNNGDAFAKNVDVNLNTGELKLRGGDISQLRKYYYKIDKGKSESFEVILLVPELIDQRSYDLSANIKGYDAKDLEYRATGSISISVSPKPDYFTISKAVRDRMYLKDTSTVSITVANGGIYDIYNIHVTDNISEDFELKSSTPLQWDIAVLKPGQEWSTTYSIKPLETSLSGFTMPAASAQYTVNNKPYTASSKTTTVVVNGPKIVLNKTVNKPVVNISEDVTVNVSINNVGNIATRAEVKDSLPEGVSLVGGSTSLASTFLELNTPEGFSYIIRMNKEGEIILPPAVADYTGVEYRGTTRSVLSSDRPAITVIDPSKIPPPQSEGESQRASVGIAAAAPPDIKDPTNTQESANAQEPSPTPIAPGFNIALAIIVLVFAAACRRR